jgi:hypothetical protein
LLGYTVISGVTLNLAFARFHQDLPRTATKFLLPRKNEEKNLGNMRRVEALPNLKFSEKVILTEGKNLALSIK